MGDLERVTEATGGQIYHLSEDGEGIADAILEGLEVRLSMVSLSLDILGDAPGFVSVTDDPNWHDVPLGETRTMKAELTGLRDDSVFGPQEYLMVIWLRGQRSAILERRPIKIVVPGIY
jgi:hypothetical protein